MADRQAKTPRGKTLAEDLRRQLADDILSGRILPGERLDEQDLADRFQVSRTPVREALRQLTATGLVETRPHRGVIVSSVTPEQLAEMFEVMADLEAACARYAALRMTEDERIALARLHQRAGELAQAGDPSDYDQLNHDFHTALYEGAHNRFLADTAQAMRTRLRPFRRAQFRVSGRLLHSFHEHDAVVRAIFRRDGEAAYHAMRGHVSAVSNASADYLSTLPGAKARN